MNGATPLSEGLPDGSMSPYISRRTGLPRSYIRRTGGPAPYRQTIQEVLPKWAGEERLEKRMADLREEDWRLEGEIQTKYRNSIKDGDEQSEEVWVFTMVKDWPPAPGFSDPPD